MKPVLATVSSLKMTESERNNQERDHLRRAVKEKTAFAKLLLWVPAEWLQGKEVKMTSKVGQKVITSKYSGTEVKCDGEEYIIVCHVEPGSSLSLNNHDGIPYIKGDNYYG